MDHPRPTLERLLPAVAIAAMAWLALFPISSVDAYYHLAIGKRILDAGEIPSRGVGSATFGDAPWHDNEWGFQLLAAAIAPTARDASGVLEIAPSGRVALVGMRALVLAATLAFLSATMARMGIGAAARAVGVVLAAFLTFGNLFWDVRPQIFTYLGIAVLLYLLERDRGGARWAVPAILGSIAIWANLHAAFIVAPFLVAAEAIGAFLERDRPRARRLALTVLLMPLAACLNPHGWLQVTHPFLYVLRPEIHEGNAEWTRPNFLRLPLFCGALLLAVVATVRGGERRFSEWGRLAASLLLLTTAIRHLPLASLVLVPTLLAALGRARWSGPSFLGGLAIASVALSGAKFVSPIPRFEERMTRPMPERAVRFLAAERIEGNGFNAYRFGGFLMFRQYPEERVFMDGRNDLYTTFRRDVWMPIHDAAPGWSERLAEATTRYDLGWLLLDADAPLARAIGGEAGWLAPLPTDPEIVLVLRDTGANRQALARWSPR
ncbi:MAG TPA: hypothetical protein VF139_07490 [Candidatus Polarisedimenticolaceae bacterium]